ncbi:MAG: RHS repeat protein [Sphingomonas bacterium]|nr:RHS repeat protein [Sphingomonas bacterium]
MPVGDAGHIERLSLAGFVTDDEQALAGVDRDHLGGAPVDALGAIVVAGELDAVTAIRENGSAVLASYAYDDLGRRTGLTRGNGTVTSYGYDPVSRLASLTQDLGGSASDLTRSFTYNAAGQIISASGNNAAYAYGYGNYMNGSVGYTANGLNGSVKRMWGRSSGDDNWLSRRPANLRRKTLHRTGRVADARKLSCAQARSYIVERPVRVGLTAQLHASTGGSDVSSCGPPKWTTRPCVTGAPAGISRNSADIRRRW